MRLIPAIDLRHGRCVRLLKGDFDRETRYEVDPIALAREYAEAGADWLHIVDLDGAASGRPVNLELVMAMKAASGLRVQMGGGIRSRIDLDAALATADRIVIGSLAVSEPDMVGDWLEEVGPERFTLGFDVRLSAGVPYLSMVGAHKSRPIHRRAVDARILIVAIRPRSPSGSPCLGFSERVRWKCAA
jgi:phosphoribosylformimino-5-aminoimidazole carboxamide ribotide isomerase